MTVTMRHFDELLGWLGMLILPSAALSILLPVVFLPFIYLMAAIAVREQGWGVLLLYGALFAAVHLFVAAVGVWLMRERPSHLLMVPVHRFIYEPLRAYLVYKSVVTALRGTRLGWNKLQRTGAVALEQLPVPAPPRPVVVDVRDDEDRVPAGAGRVA